MSEVERPAAFLDKKLENQRWIGANYKELVKKYDMKWIAVLEKSVVAVGKSYLEVRKKVEEKYGDKAKEAAIEFVSHVKMPDFDSG